MTNINLPPYGKRLYHSQKNHITPTGSVYLFVGDNCWEKAKNHDRNKFAMCLPDRHLPHNYDWPVNGCEVIIWYHNQGLQNQSDNQFLTDESKILLDLDVIAACLFRDGAKRVLIDINNKLKSIYSNDQI